MINPAHTTLAASEALCPSGKGIAMSTSHSSAICIHRKSAAALLCIAAIIVAGPDLTAPANAEPVAPSQGDMDAFNGCLWGKLNAIKAKHNGTFTTSDVQRAATDCCTD